MTEDKNDKVSDEEKTAGEASGGTTDVETGNGSATENEANSEEACSESKDKLVKERLKNANVIDEKLIHDLKEFIRDKESPTLNVVIANSIEGSSFFGGKVKDKAAERNYKFTDRTDFLSFMAKKENSFLKRYMLLLIGLRVVEIGRINYYIEQMKQGFQWSDESGLQDAQLPFSETVHVLGVHKATIERQTQAGKINTEAIAYTEEDVYKIRTIFWEEYVYMRQPMIEWLARLCRSGTYTDRMMAEDALADFAGMDFYAVYDTLSAQSKQAKYSSQFYGMARILQRAWENKRYQENIELLLSGWLQKNGENLWQIVLLCYMYNQSMVDRGQMQECLYKKADAFLENRSWVYFLVLRAHESMDVCNILYDALAVRFAEVKEQVEKGEVCLGFLNLLMLECYVIREKGGKMAFIQAFEQKERRKIQEPMMRWIWRTTEYRRLLENVLDWYFSNLPDDFDEEYMRLFFRMLAFANSRNDYENMEAYLLRSRKGHDDTVKKRLRQWLYNLRMQKRIAGEVK